MASRSPVETVNSSPEGSDSAVVYTFAPRHTLNMDMESVGSSPHELAIVEATDLFNASQYRRTVAGIAKSLGAPQASVVALSGVNAEVVVTVAWDISWYQYRVTADASPVRLAERGHDPEELEGSFTDWNAHMEDDGRVVPDIARP